MNARIIKSENGKHQRTIPEEIENSLSRFNQNNSNYQWYGSGNPVISESEEIYLILEGNFILYEDNKLNDSTIICTNKRMILFGIEVRTTLVASMVSREVEKKRDLLSKTGQLVPHIFKGWDISHDEISNIEIVKKGEIFSLFFFQQEKRSYIINDVKETEMNTINEFFSENFNIEIIFSVFQIPISDILLLIGIGIVLTIVGWILVAIIF